MLWPGVAANCCWQWLHVTYCLTWKWAGGSQWGYMQPGGQWGSCGLCLNKDRSQGRRKVNSLINWLNVKKHTRSMSVQRSQPEFWSFPNPSFVRVYLRTDACLFWPQAAEMRETTVKSIQRWPRSVHGLCGAPTKEHKCTTAHLWSSNRPSWRLNATFM